MKGKTPKVVVVFVTISQFGSYVHFLVNLTQMELNPNWPLKLTVVIVAVNLSIKYKESI